MQRLLWTILVLAWGLWFGAVVMVFIAVTSLFQTFAGQRAVAGSAAAEIFRRFEILHLLTAAAAVLVTAVLIRTGSANRRRLGALLVAFALAAGAALGSTLSITPQISNLRRHGLTDTAAFRKAHGTSMMIYSAEAASLLAAGLLLPGAIGFAGTTTFTPRREP
jgi:hypothetical protein